MMLSLSDIYEEEEEEEEEGEDDEGRGGDTVRDRSIVKGVGQTERSDIGSSSLLQCCNDSNYYSSTTTTTTTTTSSSSSSRDNDPSIKSSSSSEKKKPYPCHGCDRDNDSKLLLPVPTNRRPALGEIRENGGSSSNNSNSSSNSIRSSNGKRPHHRNNDYSQPAHSQPLPLPLSQLPSTVETYAHTDRGNVIVNVTLPSSKKTKTTSAGKNGAVPFDNDNNNDNNNRMQDEGVKNHHHHHHHHHRHYAPSQPWRRLHDTTTTSSGSGSSGSGSSVTCQSYFHKRPPPDFHDQSLDTAAEPEPELELDTTGKNDSSGSASSGSSGRIEPTNTTSNSGSARSGSTSRVVMHKGKTQRKETSSSSSPSREQRHDRSKQHRHDDRELHECLLGSSHVQTSSTTATTCIKIPIPGPFGDASSHHQNVMSASTAAQSSTATTPSSSGTGSIVSCSQTSSLSSAGGNHPRDHHYDHHYDYHDAIIRPDPSWVEDQDHPRRHSTTKYPAMILVKQGLTRKQIVQLSAMSACGFLLVAIIILWVMSPVLFS